MELVMCMFCNNHVTEEHEEDKTINIYCKILRDRGDEFLLYDDSEWLPLAHEQHYCDLFAWDCNMTLLVRKLVLLNNWFCKFLEKLSNVEMLLT